MNDRTGGESTKDWAAGSAFLGSILAGFLIGFLLDRWLDTSPWFTVIGIVAGSGSGFFQMWQLMKAIEPPESVTLRSTELTKQWDEDPNWNDT